MKMGPSTTSVGAKPSIQFMLQPRATLASFRAHLLCNQSCSVVAAIISTSHVMSSTIDTGHKALRRLQSRSAAIDMGKITGLQILLVHNV